MDNHQGVYNFDTQSLKATESQSAEPRVGGVSKMRMNI